MLELGGFFFLLQNLLEPVLLFQKGLIPNPSPASSPVPLVPLTALSPVVLLVLVPLLLYPRSDGSVTSWDHWAGPELRKGVAQGSSFSRGAEGASSYY